MMWTRQEVKQRAREALSRNYWKIVLVSFLIIFLGGGASAPASATRGIVDRDEPDMIILEDVNPEAFSERAQLVQEMVENADSAVNETVERLEQVEPVVWIAFAIVIVIVFCIAAAVVIALDIFLVNPICIGAQRFMLKSVDDRGNIAELGYTFDHNYKNGVRTAFFRDLHIFLWALLFVIPGIYKKYQYYMVDFILAENPDMDTKEVLEWSKRMMDGHKWDAFVLDLSFILWHILSTLTCGILEIFYVKPYIYLSRASLYRTLCERNVSSQSLNGARQEMIVDMEQQ